MSVHEPGCVGVGVLRDVDRCCGGWGEGGAGLVRLGLLRVGSSNLNGGKRQCK